MAGYGFSHTPKKVPLVETPFRRIKTAIPVPESIPLLEKMYAYESHSMHGQLPVVWDHAKGFQVYDSWGNCWIDFTSTIFVANAGHSNPRIIKAIKKVLDKPLVHTYSFANVERVEYLETLIKNTPSQFEKAFLLSGGTEATECALKLMRLYGQEKNKRRGGVICFDGSFHGRTMGAQMMSGSIKNKEWIGFLDPNIFHLQFPYPWISEVVADPVAFFKKIIKKLLDEQKLDPRQDLCGFMLETYQGWAGVLYPPPFVKAVVEFAREHDLLVTFDEMQSGFGRTGKLFGYMHYNVEPDILCCGKGASSGLPLAIVLGSKKVMDLPDIGSMSSTHSANPLVCAAGKANLEALIEDGIIENSAKLGEVFHQELLRIKNKFSDHINSIQGKGLLAGVIFNDPQGEPLIGLCDRIAECCMQRGLLVVHTGRESIKLAPPLCIHEAALFEGLSVFEQTIADCVSEGFE